MSGTELYKTGTSNDEPFDIHTNNTIEVEIVGCEQCGEEFPTTAPPPANLRLCGDCFDAPEPFENMLNIVGVPFPKRPLMEYGPMSSRWHDE